MDVRDLATQLENGAFDARLAEVYGPPIALPSLRARYTELIEEFSQNFPGIPATLFSSPGRTEMGGNHTDHQLGRVLAGSVSLDMIACGGVNDSRTIRIAQAGYPDTVIDIDDLDIHPEEAGDSTALVRGVARGLADRGYALGGVSVAIASGVPSGSGLSSSAAYEVLIGVILNHFFCDDDVDAVELAQIGQFAENQFFGKPCGLLDQLACSVGGVVYVDFGDPTTPKVERIEIDMAGHALCTINSGADHADLTHEYASIIDEMKVVAAYFGARYLSEVQPARFWAELADVRAQAGDRAVLRAIHFFEDNARVPLQAAALREGRFADFLDCVTASGLSSATQLQNLYVASDPQQQAVGVTIAVAKHLLGGAGAVRVHGGGFAGTVQAYVPEAQVAEFAAAMDTVLGAGSCHVLSIRPVGGAVIAG